MKKLILTGMSLLFAITLTFAQDVTPEQKAQETVVTLTEKLTLTPEQQEAIYPIVLDAKQKKAALQADTTQSPEEVEAQIATLLNMTHAKVAEQLTDEQKQLYAAYLEDRKKEQGE